MSIPTEMTKIEATLNVTPTWWDDLPRSQRVKHLPAVLAFAIEHAPFCTGVSYHVVRDKEIRVKVRVPIECSARDLEAQRKAIVFGMDALRPDPSKSPVSDEDLARIAMSEPTLLAHFGLDEPKELDGVAVLACPAIVEGFKAPRGRAMFLLEGGRRVMAETGDGGATWAVTGDA